MTSTKSFLGYFLSSSLFIFSLDVCAQYGPLATGKPMRSGEQSLVSKGGSDNGSGGISPVSDPTPADLGQLEKNIDKALKNSAEFARHNQYLNAYNVLSTGLRMVYLEDCTKRISRGFTSKALGWTVSLIELFEDERYFLIAPAYESEEFKLAVENLNYKVRYLSLKAQAEFVQTPIRDFDHNTWFKGVASEEESQEFAIAVLNLAKAHFAVAEKVYKETRLLLSEQDHDFFRFSNVIKPKEDLFFAFISQHMSHLYDELNNPETLQDQKIQSIVKHISFLNFCMNNMIARNLILVDLHFETGFVDFQRTFVRVRNTIEKRLEAIKRKADSH
jgi:hypothetical protein